ncbi:MAG: hypothetical protein NC121_17975 [Blautia sp.]|nr:hypothetical protein [Muribaculaceae bacterium]MCM1543129.1 hypothetical protein [Blautia sp.]
MKLSKLIAFGLSAIMVLSLTACGDKQDDIQTPNPFTEHKTLTDAEKEAGFGFNVPGAIQDFDECVYRSDKDNGMLEVIFKNGDEEICFRKAVGGDNPSGNYNKFSETDTVDADGVTVTMKGDGGKVKLAVWSSDGYAYSIDSTTAITKAAMTDYVKAVMTAESAMPGGDSSAWEPVGGDSVMPSSPFIDCSTMADAVELAGFDIIIPGTPVLLQAWADTMIQVLYGEDGSDMIIRKAVGSGDTSGDYNEYVQVETVDGVTLKGENGVFFLAVWEKPGYTYSISVGKALPQADMMALAAAVR